MNARHQTTAKDSTADDNIKHVATCCRCCCRWQRSRALLQSWLQWRCLPAVRWRGRLATPPGDSCPFLRSSCAQTGPALAAGLSWVVNECASVNVLMDCSACKQHVGECCWCVVHIHLVVPSLHRLLLHVQGSLLSAPREAVDDVLQLLADGEDAMEAGPSGCGPL